MDWDIILSLIRPELFIMIVALWCIGLFLKKIPTFKDEWAIPLIILALAIIMTVLYVAVVLGEGFTGASIMSSILQGIIIAALTVFGNEIIKQLLVKRPEDAGK